MVQQWIDKARVLVEALPYMRRFQGKILVIKSGGRAMNDAALRESFAVDVVLMKHIGLRPVIVHGGGPQIARELEARGIESRFVNGLRATSDAAMEVVAEVLGGELNRAIVARIAQALGPGGEAEGLRGDRDGILQVRRRSEALGRVGEVVAVNAAPIRAALEHGRIPVVAPLGADEAGLPHNVNADEAAGAIAQKLAAEKLILLTDVEGVRGAGQQTISQLGAEEAQRLIGEGVIEGGMIPKVTCCLAALRGGVQRAHIVDGRILHALLLEIFTDEGVGTLLLREDAAG